MTELLDLCYDVLIRILEELNPSDLAACAATSSAFHEFIKRNKRLYKAHYLQNFDDPRRRPTDAEPDWVDELQNAVRWQKILESADNDLKRTEFPFILRTSLSLISTASLSSSGHSHNSASISRLFLHISQNHNAFMSRSSLYARAGTELQRPADDAPSRQLSAKLHCLFGIPSSNVGRRVLSAHPFARAKVYDLRNYTEGTGWGPFLDDGKFRVDWEMVESLMIVLGYNSGLCCRRFQPRFSPPWAKPLQGVVPEKEKLGSREWDAKMVEEVDVPLKMKDPFNVSGVWSRIVCFLDYNDLHAFNFSDSALKHPPSEPRDPLVTDEAIRHIIMDLKVTSVTPSEDSSYPVVEFSGTSRSVDAAWDPNANSKIRGSVRMTTEGEVRWQTISVFYG
ncbi:hypothetical protein IQ06DRAFT_296691 [Phaeosphaeriaceae sp. SRC1lsM3a]|nr:hypothetical protein IQ06DRAFT_296691 [Stagonospora sp. SRC1lsM3a]